MKIQGLIGSGSGKLGNTVFRTSGGVQVVAQYQPNVANPSTTAQVNQRAKLKLLSQIAAALSPAIVIPKDGNVSSRNLFIKRNFKQASATSGVAQLSYENLQLTNGNAGLPNIVASRDGSKAINVSLNGDASASVDRVVYIEYRKSDENHLQYVDSKIISVAGENGSFPASMPYVAQDAVIFAYGMKAMDDKAKAVYDDYEAESGLDIARLVMRRNITYSNTQFTQTRGTTLYGSQQDTGNVGSDQARVYVTPVGPGTATGAGVFDIGSQVTVTATPNTGAKFKGWRKTGTSTILSTQLSYSFTLNATTDLQAVFSDETGPDI